MDRGQILYGLFVEVSETVRKHYVDVFEDLAIFLL
jgi:hypothetical protein